MSSSRNNSNGVAKLSLEDVPLLSDAKLCITQISVWLDVITDWNTILNEASLYHLGLDKDPIHVPMQIWIQHLLNVTSSIEMVYACLILNRLFGDQPSPSTTSTKAPNAADNATRRPLMHCHSADHQLPNFFQEQQEFDSSTSEVYPDNNQHNSGRQQMRRMDNREVLVATPYSYAAASLLEQSTSPTVPTQGTSCGGLRSYTSSSSATDSSLDASSCSSSSSNQKSNVSEKVVGESCDPTRIQQERKKTPTRASTPLLRRHLDEITAYNRHRILFVCVILAHKYLHDQSPVSLTRWSQLGNHLWCPALLSRCEILCLERLNWNMYASNKEFLALVSDLQEFTK